MATKYTSLKKDDKGDGRLLTNARVNMLSGMILSVEKLILSSMKPYLLHGAKCVGASMILTAL